MSDHNNQKRNSMPISSPPKFRNSLEESQSNKVISSSKRIRKIHLEKLSDPNENEDKFNRPCEQCSTIKEQTIIAINHIREYIDNINLRLNLLYHKSGQKKPSSAYDLSLPLDYFHTMYYSQLDKVNLGSETLNNIRSLMKSIRLMNDKLEYIKEKHEFFEKRVMEYKKLKISNLGEEMSLLPQTEINDINNLQVQDLFKNFNRAKENIDNSLRNLKKGAKKLFRRTRSFKDKRNTHPSQNDSKSSDIVNIKSDLKKNQSNYSKELFLKNEVNRLLKENTSLRVEMNYIYDQLKDNSKVFFVRDDKTLKKIKSGMLSNTSAKSPDGRKSNASSSASPGNSLLILNVKGENKDKKYFIARDYIKILEQSEFYML